MSGALRNALITDSARMAQVEVLSGPHKGAQLLLNKTVLGVGRGSENALVLMKDLKVSRFHIEFRFVENQWLVENISQKNFMEISGKVVRQSSLLGDVEIVIGDSLLRFSLPKKNIDAEDTRRLAIVNPSPPIGRTRAGPAAAGPSGAGPSALNAGRVRFYGGIAVAVVLVGWLMSTDTPKKEQERIRSSDEVMADLAQSESAIRDLQTQIEKKGTDTPQFQSAEQHYLKGFRDYQQGQYGRAMQSFQAALSFYPSHELARKYLVLARRKFDELARFHLTQGRRYRGKNNFRLCSASYAQVLIMVKDSSDPIYKEAKQYYDECELRKQGR